MQLPSPPLSVISEQSTQPLPPSQTSQNRSQPDLFSQLLQAPVVSVSIGSDPDIARYNLPVALLCHHSHFFRQEILRYKAVRAQLGDNKKRKLSPEDETMAIQVKVEDSESPSQTISSNEFWHVEDAAVVKLPDVDPSIFGLFLKYVYTGHCPTAVDAKSDAAHSVPHTTTSTQLDAPCTPARASMPPLANINSRSTLPGAHLPCLPISVTSTFTISLQESRHNDAIPPSIHAYLLAVQLGAPGFLNQAITHIYYGIGKHFVLDPSLVHYIWSNTLPQPFCSSSPVRKLILDVMAVHWSSTSLHVVAKQPALHKYWNELLDTHRDLRHEFTMGLQGGRKVLPVQAYFVKMSVSDVPVREEAKRPEVQVIEIEATATPSAAESAGEVATAASAAAKEQDNGSGHRKK